MGPEFCRACDETDLAVRAIRDGAWRRRPVAATWMRRPRRMNVLLARFAANTWRRGRRRYFKRRGFASTTGLHEVRPKRASPDEEGRAFEFFGNVAAEIRVEQGIGIQHKVDASAPTLGHRSNKS